ncbi:Carbamoyl-phosphate synthetase large subunit ATP-binding protein [Macrophomina phaseolina MS6]|uniref:Carbamoyl-phosphate synthetase large subunit ATP-binding protein n=1 Tax=Macrophomina phaseolina (strain MS6) TaxID=1126212 RepID=K2RJ48_MACPH|nr:Carbamoyl-phosphate synthetase large subunit ATP-binding protein [Macrophomina phaseolina MS6]
MTRPPLRPIKRLLVCNRYVQSPYASPLDPDYQSLNFQFRGEIATRIISAARELDVPTYAVYTQADTTHVRNATHAIELPSAASYLDTSYLIQLIRDHGIDAVHPGYGFLSESAEFARRAWEEAGAVVIGPGWEVLEQTGDKLKARRLAEECSVPVTPALLTATNNVDAIRSFAESIGYPIMIKAVDGGGGRGIRLVRHADELASLAQRAIEESPSRQVFAEKAAVDGFRHVEVQIVGDGTGKGGIRHLWERECSIQRRYQKVIEVAPSTIQDRSLVNEMIEAAVRMAEKIHYFSLGTFEFLLNPDTRTYYFLETNPRLQVEHTITEALLPGLDLVQAQLLLSQGVPLASIPRLPPQSALPTPPPPPAVNTIQLRLTAETPSQSFTLSPGPVTLLRLPSSNGPGVRVDTHAPTRVSTEFDSLIAKIVVCAPTWNARVEGGGAA